MIPKITLSAVLATGLAAAAPLPIIPQPVSVTTGTGSFPFSSSTRLVGGPGTESETTLFGADLRKLTGPGPKTDGATSISLSIDAKLELPAGGYKLSITPERVTLVGRDAAGVYHGTRTILQLLPPPGDPAWKDAAPEQIPAAEIADHPRFAWRGMMLDTGRHFAAPEDIKRFIDQLAFHKMNVFHWHLTEDQGWRIEIKKYPKLTSVGGWRDSTPPYGNRNSDDGKRYGGFYTQEQIKDIVAYATARHVTVVPEIEMPGHAAAAITAYPEFGNDDIPGYAPKVVTRWGVFPYTFAPKEETFRFLDDVLTEVCALFPSTYIHIGGDEAPKDQWDKSPRVKELMKKENLKDTHEVQSYFIHRIEKILAAKGRKLIGWDEIREGGLSPEANVMSWRGEKGGIDSAKEGHDVVMAANSHLYFDKYQEPPARELAKGKDKEAIGGFLPIEMVYGYNPVPKALDAAQAKHIIGVQAQLWSEYMHDFAKVEYMAFPRIAALAEISWTPLARKDYPDFRVRLDTILKHYDAAGIRRGAPFDKPKKETKDGSTVTTSLSVYEDNAPEFVFDGRQDTIFWSAREVKADDHVTLALKTPLSSATPVRILTGGSEGKMSDTLAQGVLEATTDGASWTKIADFAAGSASGSAPAGTTGIRLRATAAQPSWLIIREFLIGG